MRPVKTVILAGGRGSRLAEETTDRPKPLVEIGGQPLLWHIMQHYAGYGLRDFVIALGYRGDMIRDWFAPRLRPGGVLSDWRVELVETGSDTNTGGRVRALAPLLAEGRFFLTWGDGVADVDLDALMAFHLAHGRLATVTAVRPPPRFGHLDLEGDRVAAFHEKPPAAEGWINGAFFVLEPAVIDRIAGPETLFEGAPLQSLARDGELMAYRHAGFWQCMDTLHDKRRLEQLWAAGNAPWKTWETDTCMSS